MNVQSAPAPGTLCLQALVEGYTDPHRLYDARRERAPISYNPWGHCWLVTGHDAGRALLSDERFVSDPVAAGPRPSASRRRSFISAPVQRQIVFRDGPEQLRVRRAVLTGRSGGRTRSRSRCATRPSRWPSVRAPKARWTW